MNHVDESQAWFCGVKVDDWSPCIEAVIHGVAWGVGLPFLPCASERRRNASHGANTTG